MDNKNLILAITLSIGILLLWSAVFEAPQQNTPVNNEDMTERSPTDQIKMDLDSYEFESSESEKMDTVSLEESLVNSERVDINTPSLSGSINLQGLKIDDLILNKFNEELDPNSEKIRFLSPSDTEKSFEISFGWIKSKDAIFETPNSKTIWTLKSPTSVLTSNSELEFEWDNQTDQIFKTYISIDEDYLFSIRQIVVNKSNQKIILNNASKIIRKQTPNLSGMFILHEGPIGVLEEKLELIDYDTLKDDKETLNFESNNGWLGITDKYWLAALVPSQGIPFKAIYTYEEDSGYVAYFRSLDASTVEAGSQLEIKTKIFAGAKEAKILDQYQERFGIYNFDLAVDWGWFYFITKPLFYAISYLYQISGNFGIAIIILTVITRILFFPLANWSFISMAKMKLLQPEMTRLKELHKDDKQQQQQALMALYKKEKVNPVSGCLPILIQIPFFFAIYKMLFVSIEMRHAPFYGWIQDLSAKDPTSLFNLFGLIPWDPPSFLVIGIWPILMGFTMYIQQKLNPAPPDPIQAKIFMFFPFFITILLSQFAAGLVIYWTTNNLLSILQQWVITRRTKVKTN